jgi:hypothetical protein
MVAKVQIRFQKMANGVPAAMPSVTASQLNQCVVAATRATAIETGLFEIQADYPNALKRTHRIALDFREIVHALSTRIDSGIFDQTPGSDDSTGHTEALPGSEHRSMPRQVGVGM